MAQCDIQALMDKAGCFACLPPGMASIQELQLLCEAIGGNVVYFTDQGAQPSNSFDSVIIT